jgi:PBP1b-binding outer membrane lipoprotein LpoB
MLKKIIIYLITILFIAFVFYECFNFIKTEANTSIIISGQSPNSKNKYLLFINEEFIDTIASNDHFAHIKNYDLDFGKNYISLKRLHSKFDYKTTITFFGLYNWNIIEVDENDSILKHYKYYYQPRFE